MTLLSSVAFVADEIEHIPDHLGLNIVDEFRTIRIFLIGIAQRIVDAGFYYAASGHVAHVKISARVTRPRVWTHNLIQ